MLRYPLSPVSRKRKLKAYALTYGLPIPPGFGTESPWIRKPARRLIERVQRHGGLPVTGCFNDATLDLLFPERFGRKLVRNAKAELGVTEVPLGTNRGPRVSEYLSVIGATTGEWCASFVAWLVAERTLWKGHRLMGDVLPARPGWVPSWELSAKGVVSWCSKPNRHLRWLPRSERKRWRRGDMLIIETGDGDPTGDHTGLFVRWLVPYVLLRSIEGNVGDRVAFKDRKASEVIGCVRIVP